MIYISNKYCRYYINYILLLMPTYFNSLIENNIDLNICKPKIENFRFKLYQVDVI